MFVYYSADVDGFEGDLNLCDVLVKSQVPFSGVSLSFLVSDLRLNDLIFHIR